MNEIEQIFDYPTNEQIFKNCFKASFDDIEFETFDIQIIYDIENYIFKKVRKDINYDIPISLEIAYKIYKKFRMNKPVVSNLISYFDISEISDNDETNDLIKEVILEIKNIILFRELAKLIFVVWNDYKVALRCSQMAVSNYKNMECRLIYEKESKGYLANIQSQNAINRWKEHNITKASLALKYLAVMKKKGFLDYTEAANYIYIDENPENKDFRFIYDRLREADKGKYS